MPRTAIRGYDWLAGLCRGSVRGLFQVSYGACPSPRVGRVVPRGRWHGAAARLAAKMAAGSVADIWPWDEHPASGLGTLLEEGTLL